MQLLSGLDGVLGGVLECVVSLLSNTKKQNEVISKPPTEGPDETEEIDIETYEESENLVGDEGFKLEM